MKSYATIVLFLSFLTIKGWSQPNQTNDPEAGKILNAVKNKYTAYNSIQVQFTYVLEDKQSGVRDEREGTLALKKDRFKLDMSDIAVITDSKTLWIHLKNEKQVQIQNYDPSTVEDEFGFAPDKMFEVDAEDFWYRMTGRNEVMVGTKTCKEIELTPKDKDKPYFKVKMYVSSANEVCKFHFYERDGAEYIFLVNSQKPNANFEEGTFRLNTSTFDPANISDFR